MTTKHPTSRRCPRPPAKRRGASLIELVISTSIMAVLFVGLGGAVVIATRSAEVGTKGSAAHTAEAARVLEQITADLRLALRFDEPLRDDVVTFTVPDTDGDDQPDTVTYAWTGSPAYELTRQVYLSSEPVASPPVVIVADVQGFELSYLYRTWGAPPGPEVLESEEVLLVAHDDRPEGDGRRALLVVTNELGPTPQELAREGLLTWWGFTVNRLSASATQSRYDDMVASVDVAYISEEIDSGDVGTKLRDAGIGVVNEEINLADEFGVAGSFGFPPPASALDVTAATHHVTSAFMPGPVPLFDASQPGTDLSSDPAEHAPGLEVLGAWSGLPSLAVLEVGAELHGAGAPGSFGFDTVFGEQSDTGDFDEKHVATRVTLTTGATVTSISAHLYMKKSKALRFGVYADGVGEPGALLGQTLEVSPPQGETDWQTFDIERPLKLPPGTYWLAIGMQKDVAFFFDPAGGETRYGDVDPSDGLMPTWTDTYGPDPNHQRLSIYANYTETAFAAGRRVTLPWGGNAFDIDALTEDGETLVRRAVEWAGDTSPGDASEPFFVGKEVWPAQYLLPPLPINATGWKITRLLVAIRADPADPGAKVRFQLRHADVNLQPTDEIIQETAEIPVATWDAYEFAWYEIPFTPVADLNPHHGVCLVIKGTDDENAVVKVDRGGVPGTAGIHFLETPDKGSTWSPPGDDDLRLHLYGTYSTQGEPTWP